jgi:hypothetical protein
MSCGDWLGLTIGPGWWLAASVCPMAAVENGS